MDKITFLCHTMKLPLKDNRGEKRLLEERRKSSTYDHVKYVREWTWLRRKRERESFLILLTWFISLAWLGFFGAFYILFLRRILSLSLFHTHTLTHTHTHTHSHTHTRMNSKEKVDRHTRQCHKEKWITDDFRHN